MTRSTACSAARAAAIQLGLRSSKDPHWNGWLWTDISRMEKTLVRCECGAKYERIEPTCLMPHSGHVSCEVCGAVLESWAESTHVATFELVKRPDGKPAMTSHPKRPVGGMGYH